MEEGWEKGGRLFGGSIKKATRWRKVVWGGVRKAKSWNKV